MTQSEWRVKILGLPEGIKSQVAASATMRQPIDYNEEKAIYKTDMALLRPLYKGEKFSVPNAIGAIINSIKNQFHEETGQALATPDNYQFWHNRFNDKATEIVAESEIYNMLGIDAPDKNMIDMAYSLTVWAINLRPELKEEKRDAEGKVISVPWEKKFTNALEVLFANAKETVEWERDARSVLSTLWVIAAIMTRRPRLDKRLWLDYVNLYEGHPLLSDSPRWELPGDWLCDQDNPEYWMSVGLSEASAIRAARRDRECVTR